MCRWLLLVAEFDERGGWHADGILTCAHWLSWRCSIGLRAAREHVRVARALGGLPLVRKAFGRGELSYCKVRALTRAVTPANEQAFLELARHATGAQLEKVVRGYRGALRANTRQARRAHERRELTYWIDDDGSVVFKGRLPAEEGALVLKALEAATEPAPIAPHGSADQLPPLPDPATDPSATADNRPGARRADALVSLARASLEREAAERLGADAVELLVHVDAGTLGSDRVHERCELEQGPSLAPETARRLGCDAALTRIIERDGRPLSISRRTRTIPPALRRALRARDKGCAFPGCTHNRFLHAHHIHHWARGGPTKLDNLVQLCSHHHRLVHEGGYQVERAGAAIRFRRPDGREIATAPSATRARGPTIEHRSGAAADQMTIRPLSAGDKLDYSIAVECLLAAAEPARAIL
jgi:5-methylcytosine-specific restriction endonuclease McrA